jgi:hypothetical protein
MQMRMQCEGEVWVKGGREVGFGEVRVEGGGVGAPTSRARGGAGAAGGNREVTRGEEVVKSAEWVDSGGGRSNAFLWRTKRLSLTGVRLGLALGIALRAERRGAQRSIHLQRSWRTASRLMTCF